MPSWPARAAAFVALALSSACAPAPPADTLTVFAAASLKEAFTELGQAFQARRAGVAISFNFAGSQQLAQQLAAGAPADVFASANQRQMDAAAEVGRVAPGAAQPFAGNRLIVVLPGDNPAGLHTLPDLARPGLRIVLAAEVVPVGQYSLEFLEKASGDPAFPASFKDGVLANVMSYEENVRAVLSKVALGEADAGIVYLSDVAGDGADRVQRLDIPDALNALAVYPIAPIADSARPALAETFVAFVLSADGQAILVRHGFLPIGP